MRFRVAFVFAACVCVGCVLDDDDGGSGGNSADGGGDGNDDDGGDGGNLGGDVPRNGYCEPVADWDDSFADFEMQVLDLVNERRSEGANCGGESFGSAPPLQMQGALRCAARVHSLDMGDRGFFDHDNPDGESPFERMELAGYNYRTAGENIAAGQMNPSMVMDSWMGSPGHCGNIMNPDFTQFGMGYHFSSTHDFGHLWTQTFGAPL